MTTTRPPMTPAHPAAEEPVPADPPEALGWRLLAALPTALPLLVVGYGTVAVAALLAGAFRPIVVVPAGLTVAVALLLLAGLPRQLPRSGRGADVAVLVFAAATVVVNAHYATQDVFVARDPGIYDVTGAWLTHHASLVIPTQLGIFGSTDPVTGFSAGFGLLPGGRVFAQGTHLLPALLASVHWALGSSRALQLPAVLGAVGLLAVYGFARRLVSPWMAVGAAVLLAATLPQIWVSRDTYTEPLDQLLTFGGLSLAYDAIRSGRRRGALLAGLVLGAGAESRADGYVTLLTLLPVLLVVLAAAPVGRRRHWTAWFATAVAAAAVPAVLALLDLQRLSPGYYTQLRGHLKLLGEAGAGLAVLGVLGVALWWFTSVPGVVERGTRRWRGPAAAGVIVLAGGLLASRPLWMVATIRNPGTAGPLVAALQRAAGEPVNPHRTYAEHTVAWLAWYLGLPGLLLAGAGLAALTGLVVAGRRPGLAGLPFLAMVVGTGLLYLSDPAIAPDQIWASRRFVPVVIPGLAVAAVWTVDQLAGRLRPRRAGAGASPGVGAAVGVGAAARVGALGGAVGLVLVLGATAAAATTSRALFRVRQDGPALTQLMTLCRALPPHAAVVFTDTFGVSAAQSVRSYCLVPAETLTGADPAQLASARAAARRAGRVLVAVATSPAGLPADPAAPPQDLSTIGVPIWRLALISPPPGVVQQVRSLYVGVVEPSGQVRALSR